MQSAEPVAKLAAMTGEIEISPALKINSARPLVHVLRTAGKPVPDVYPGGGYWISFDDWEVDAATVDEAVSNGWLVLTYPKKSPEWWRLRDPHRDLSAGRAHAACGASSAKSGNQPYGMIMPYGTHWFAGSCSKNSRSFVGKSSPICLSNAPFSFKAITATDQWSSTNLRLIHSLT
jgi:hypothetical protein